MVLRNYTTIIKIKYNNYFPNIIFANYKEKYGILSNGVVAYRVTWARSLQGSSEVNTHTKNIQGVLM